MDTKFKQTALMSVDSYKLGHADQFPVGTTRVYSNFTPRSMSHFAQSADYKDNRIVWVGLQAFLYELTSIFKETFFDRHVDAVCNEFSEFVAPFVGPRGFNVDRIRALHRVGYLPLKIKALPEGSRVNVGVPCLTITNTMDEFFWLTNYLETWISNEMWKTCTSATTAALYRRISEHWADITGGSKEFIQWQAHDFSCRGMSGMQDAAKSGMGHLLSFTGTDTLAAVKLINDVYKGKETFVGGSVPASEHAVMAAGTADISELETYRRFIKDYPSGVVSIVSDTYDFWNVITNTAATLKEEILARVPDQFGLAKVVFRPDSGDPVAIICGDLNEPAGSPAFKGAVECLWDIFGGTTNEKGFRTLNQRVGLIYGDSITPQRAEAIFQQLASKGFASDNIVFGVGSYTYQYQTRDTLGFAMKCTSVEINGKLVEVFKDPVTDTNKTKKSAKGLLRVDRVGKNFVLRDQVTPEEENDGELKVVFINGNILSNENFADMRSRLEFYK